jgi:hypothetical protein
MESNRIYYYFFKYVFLVAGLLIAAVPTISFVFEGRIEINGEVGSIDWTTAVIMLLLGLIAVLVFFLIKDKFAIVVLENQTITIKQNGEERTIDWLDVMSVSQFQFVQPPLYALKTKDSDQTIWFNTEPKYISINGLTSDISAMGKLITKKKMELGL